MNVIYNAFLSFQTEKSSMSHQEFKDKSEGKIQKRSWHLFAAKFKEKILPEIKGLNLDISSAFIYFANLSVDVKFEKLFLLQRTKSDEQFYILVDLHTPSDAKKILDDLSPDILQRIELVGMNLGEEVGYYPLIRRKKEEGWKVLEYDKFLHPVQDVDEEIEEILVDEDRRNTPSLIPILGYVVTFITVVVSRILLQRSFSGSPRRYELDILILHNIFEFLIVPVVMLLLEGFLKIFICGVRIHPLF